MAKTRPQLERWAKSFEDFAVDMFALLGKELAPFQMDLVRELSPALMVVATNGEVPAGVKMRFWIEWTKGCGKDLLLAVINLWLVAFSRVFVDAQVAAADKDQAGDFLKWVKMLLRECPALESLVEVLTWSITSKNPKAGSVCTILASDVAGSHGARPSSLCLNELSHVTKEEFAANLMDNATKVTNGLVIGAMNAGHVGTWPHKWMVNAQESDRWSFHRYAAPAPWLDPREIEEARRRNPATRFRRLFEGVWSAGGDALSYEDIQAAIVPELKPATAPIRGFLNVVGIDLSTRKDRSAAVHLGTDTKTGRVRLMNHKFWRPVNGKIDLQAVQDHIFEISRTFPATTFVFDPFQAELLAAQCRRRGLMMIEMPFTGQNLVNMASAILELFTAREIDMYPCPELEKDLVRLTIEEKPYGFRLSSTRDADGHADLATALAIAAPFARGRIERAANPAPSTVEGRPLGERLFRGQGIYQRARRHPACEYHDYHRTQRKRPHEL